MKKRERIYDCCGKVAFTFSKAPRCTDCSAIAQYSESRQRTKSLLEKFDYADVTDAERTHYGRIQLRFTHIACETTQVWTLTNLEKVLKKDPNTAPCSHCGSKRRTAEATRVSALNNGVPDDQLPAWEAYRRRTRRLTEQTYRLHKATINPLNLKRGLTTYHLDHKFPIIEGFLQGHQPEFIARVQNLRMMTSTENISKGRQLWI
jgi:hypothetical protein